jgi:predicted GTPase
MYPDGIPIFPEEELTDLIRKNNVTKVYFSYSDTSHEYVMHRASQVQAAGASFILLGPVDTMVKSVKPVISICAVRTGCGKSQTTRKVGAVLIAKGRKVAAIRHPMPYGDLAVQKVQRFAAYEDLDKHHCTIEEREEYEPHIKAGIIVYAGVDYEAILREAEKEADVILWDGGNNDFPFYKSDLEIVVVDPHRAGHELLYYPGETNFRRAQVIVINKMDTAPKEGVDKILENIKAYNPGAIVIKADSPTHVENGEQIRGKRVLVVEDGPTVTHGGMPFGAGVVTAEKYGAGELVDPRPFAVESIAATYAKYPHMVKILPAMGYGEKQVADLAATIDKVDCDLIISATPIDLNRLIKTRKPMLPVGYDLQEIGSPTIEDVLQKF